MTNLKTKAKALFSRKPINWGKVVADKKLDWSDCNKSRPTVNQYNDREKVVESHRMARILESILSSFSNHD